jgi:hypothetical protein
MNFKVLIILLFSKSIYSQNNDFVWNMGHIGCENEPYDSSIYCRYSINFNYDPALLICDRDRKFELAGTNSFYCKDSGELFCVSNGMQIYNKENQIMKNGQSISLNGFWNYSVIKNACGPGLDIIRGYYLPQANLFLPWPKNENKLLYIAARYEVASERAEGAWYCVIDMTKNNGLGEVVEKDVDLFEEDIAFCFRTAVRHAN